MPFNKPYQFKRKNIVVIQHPTNKHLRVHPKQLQKINHNGGKGQFARWEADPQENGTKVRFKSTKTNKFLRIMKNKRNGKYIVNVGGTGGKFTIFNVKYVDEDDTKNGKVKLESNVFPGIYIAVNQSGVGTGTGGDFCVMKIYRQTGKKVAAVYKEQQQEEEAQESSDDGTTTEEEDDDDEDDESPAEEEEYEDVVNDVYIEDEEEDVVLVEKEKDDKNEEEDDSVVVHEVEEKDESGDSNVELNLPKEAQTGGTNTTPIDDADAETEDLLNIAESVKLLEGYCLVFKRETEYHHIEVVDLELVGDEGDLAMMPKMCQMTNVHGIKNDNNKALSWKRKPDIADQEFEEKATKRLKGTNMKNLLRGFNEAHIQYKIIYSRPSLHRPEEEDQINPNDEGESKYIYVVIWMDAKYCESYADYQDVSVLINREEAIKAGRKFNEFHLAHRTYLPGFDQDDLCPLDDVTAATSAVLARRKIEDDLNTRSSVVVQGFGSQDWDSKQNEAKQSAIESRNGKMIKKLPIECWNNIHIPFEYSIKGDAKQNNIYELYPSANNPDYKTVVTHRLYLRILYSCLVDDRSQHGADFLVDYYLKDKNHPFETIFALHEYDNANYYPVRNPRVPLFAAKLYKFGWINKETYQQINDDIREYFGEYIAYYYAFLIHYIQSMLPMVIIGLIWFIVQLGAGTISVGGSTFYVLICVIWSTIMIEAWYRKESSLKYKWGMCRYTETEVPRPTFKGEVKVSEYNGDIIEDHKNIFKYWGKIVLSLSTMVLCIACVISIVVTIWILKRAWKDDAGRKMAIGIINSIQIKICNVLYTKLAYALNDFEQHRLVEDYYNHLVVKRIIFIVVNSFNSLFYMAFWDNSYDNNEDRLNSLRIQLITLFVMAIILGNFLEVVLPNMKEWFRKYKQNKKNEEGDELPKDVEAGIHVPAVSNAEIDDEITDPEGEFNDIRFTGGLEPEIILDIENQILAPRLPSTLDNVAEIVVLQGYIILFAVVLPIMPLFAYINAIFEIRVDVYNLVSSQRPFPLGADGIGVWRAVLSIFNTMAIFSNMAVIAWDTDLPEVVLGLKISGVIIWYFLICLFMLIAMVSIRLVLPNETMETKKAMARQEQCETLVTLLQDSTPNRDVSQVGQRKQLKQIS